MRIIKWLKEIFLSPDWCVPPISLSNIPDRLKKDIKNCKKIIKK